MKLEHVGIAVSDAQRSTEALRRVLGMIPYKVEDVASESVRTTFLDAGGPRLELLEATSADSAIARHLDRRGEGLHHLAFEVDDIHSAHQHLAAEGVRLLNDAPKRGADEKLIFFVHPRETAGVLVEICQSSPVTLQESSVVDGIAVFERGRPDAPPVILLHSALGATEFETRHLFPWLEPHFRVLGVDFSGHGKSRDGDASTPSINTYANEVLSVMDALELPSASLFGFSMGAVVALRLAHLQPERVERVVSHAANVRWDEAEAQQMLAAIQPEALERNTPSWRQRLADAHGEDQWRRLAERMGDYIKTLPSTHVLDDDLADIGSPTLVSHGDRDRFFRLQHALHLHSVIPGAQLAVHPGMKHKLGPAEAALLGPMTARFLRA